MAKKARMNRKLYWTLLLASVASTFLILPYAFTLQPQVLSQSPVSIEVFLLLQLVQVLLIFSVVIFIGLHLGHKVGLGAPILTRALKGKKVSKWIGRILWPSIGLGVATALLIFALDFAFSFSVDLRSFTAEVPPVWQGFLALFYGAIGEEILMRLFLMTLFVWISFKIKAKKKKPTVIGVWIAIILTALIFGAAHLPILASVTELTIVLVIRTIVLNGVGGVVFGWLFWKKGLESAMLAHFSASLILHGVPSILF